MQQGKRGRLAGSGRAHQRHRFARQHGERQVGDRRALAVIGERNVLEFDQAAHAPGVDRILAVVHGRIGIEHAEEFP